LSAGWWANRGRSDLELRSGVFRERGQRLLRSGETSVTSTVTRLGCVAVNAASIWRLKFVPVCNLFTCRHLVSTTPLRNHDSRGWKRNETME
jgi:hypothetical protein